MLLLSPWFTSAQTVEAPARAFRENGSPAARLALERMAAAHPDDRDGALALLALGLIEHERRLPADAVRDLRAAATRLPQVADYIAYYLAASLSDLGNFAAAIQELAPVWAGAPASPLLPDAALLEARARKEAGQPAEAVAVLRKYYSLLPQPTGDMLLAQCYRAANDPASAAAAYQRVYFQYPAVPDSEQAAAALAELKTALGDLYPRPATELMFQRADRWLRSGDARRARAEYDWIAAQTTGGDRDLARVRRAEMEYFRYENSSAYGSLKALDVSGEADAERLYYMAECARRLERDDQMMDAVHRLSETHPQSLWRLKALVTAANRYLLDNRAADYEPLYRACYDSFPTEPQADYCHWKFTWNAYLHQRPDALELLREHLVKFPGSEHASGALYYLGRLAENANQPDTAKAYYTEAVERFPNHYYSMLAGQRLTAPALFGATTSESVRGFLNTMVWPVRQPALSFEPTVATQLRIDRAHLFDSVGFEDLAERELRFGAAADGQAHVLAIHLAEDASRYDSPHRAMRAVKNLVPGYLAIPIESAPAAFWRLLFPLPYRTELERYARQRDLDPSLVAGLVRQESEFNPQAVSHAQAYGLTQLLPSTGRQLLRMSRRRFRATILFRPEVNLRLGTTYLRSIYDENGASWEQALASYNAGASRVQNWLGWAKYREPVEFVETIPFSETRGYVFAVLRNAEMYRRLYARGVGPLAGERLEPVRKKLAAAPARKKGPFKRTPVVPKKKTRRRR